MAEDLDDLPPADYPLPSPAEAGLSDLAAAVVERERQLAAERAYRPPLWKRLVAVLMLLLTIVLALAASAVFTLAIWGMAHGGFFIQWQYTETNGARLYAIGGPFGELLIGFLLLALANTQSRIRKRFLTPRARSTAKPSARCTPPASPPDS